MPFLGTDDHLVFAFIKFAVVLDQPGIKRIVEQTVNLAHIPRLPASDMALLRRPEFVRISEPVQLQRHHFAGPELGVTAENELRDFRFDWIDNQLAVYRVVTEYWRSAAIFSAPFCAGALITHLSIKKN